MRYGLLSVMEGAAMEGAAAIHLEPVLHGGRWFGSISLQRRVEFQRPE
jgi:hypothetical protein